MISEIKAGVKLQTRSKKRVEVHRLSPLLPNWLMKKNSENGNVKRECLAFTGLATTMRCKKLSDPSRNVRNVCI